MTDPSYKGPVPDTSDPEAAATYRLEGHIATITYNRPEAMNAINGDMRQCLNAAWMEFYNDPDAWVAIMTGSGRAFCAGADLRDPTRGSAGIWSGSYFEIPTINSLESGLELFKPVIAAVNGACIGYGLTGALVADFLIASDRALFGMPEVKIGVPTIVGSMRMPHKIGWANAMEILLTGDNIDADRAREMGLAWKVVPHDTLMDEARDLAARLCQGAPLAVRAVKEVAWRSQRMGWTEALRMGESIRKIVGDSDDAKEGGRAFAAKRPPKWTGA
ncbi:enoyl-CoA hydratase/isomerase family protein [Candidatus Poriferisodalis sp.]|uniref:enoyl-CoA hydratase/isomerase family protein n=1 Tax=Candidatus Poriferisodalis sp. TaxID=3101277 RepID=UPI003D0D00AB